MAYALTYKLINNGTACEVTGYTGEPTNVVIPKEYNGKPITSISYSAFTNCSSLTSMVIGASVTSIGNSAFYNCSSLTSVIIPDSVTSIGYQAFAGCSSLTSVTIPDSVTSISDGAFYNCSSLTSVIIPDSVTSIGSGAFSTCSSLTSVVIPNGVTMIGASAFYGCSSLNEVIVLGVTPPNVSDPFPSSVQIYCYAQALNTYKNAAGWSASSLMANDIKLYFIMNARAQKRYFLAKNELGDLHFENNYIHWTGDPYDGIKIGMDEMDLRIWSDGFQLFDNYNLGDWVLSYDGPNEELYINPNCYFYNNLYVDGDITVRSGTLYSSSPEIYLSPVNEDNYLRISDDDELIELKANSDGATISLITEGSTGDTGIELHSVSPSADSKIYLGPEGGSFWGYDRVTILSTHNSNGNINSQSDGARLSMDCDGRITFTAFGSDSTTFTWNGKPILTKANFKLTGTNKDILEITV